MKARTAVNEQFIVSRAERIGEKVPRWVMPLARSAIVIADALIAVASFLAAFAIREGSSPFADSSWSPDAAFVPYVGVVFFAAVVRPLMLGSMRGYHFHGAFSYTREFSKILKAAAVGSLLMIAWAFLFRGGFTYRDFSYSRTIFLVDLGLFIALISAFHLGIRVVQTMFREKGINLIPTLIIGTNAEALQTLEILGERKSLGYEVIGVVECGSRPDRSFFASGTKIIGGIDDLPDLIRDLSIQEVIITDNTLPSSALFETMLQAGRDQRVEFRFAPSLFNLLPQKTSVEQIGVLPMVRLFREPLSDSQRFLKRSFDVVVSALALAVTAPVWLIIALLIRRDSKGPIFFKQERVGMDGRVFLCYKFRTMKAHCREDLHREAYKRNIDGDVSCGENDDAVFGKVRNDPRVTRFGAKLRRTSLDELPQLLNVIRGDMSFVGPRPPIPYEVEEYKTHHRKRLDMKPGITGLWQVSGRSRLSFEEMVSLDIFYIENWSFLLDLKILVMTFPAIWRGEGAE
jgi:exopolysaccharide biosynthesis polyprenyl glycosylphosphotransferase